MAEKVCFSESLYRREAVEKSAAVFSEIADFSLSFDDVGVVVLVENIHPEMETVLLDVFCNYVLNETIILSRKEKGGDV
jgi:hypothetical protein